MTPFYGSRKEAFRKHCGKGEIAQAISPFPTMFSTLSKAGITIFVTFVVCKCFQFSLVQNFVVWEWVKFLSQNPDF